MASNKKLKFKVGDLLKAKWNSPDSLKYILILEAIPSDALSPSYYILNLLSGGKHHVQRTTIEAYYTIAK